jgi:p-aminobenzoyl-glutamate transporter AbgT
MFKKIVLVIVMAVAVGGLVFGAVNRTLAKTTNEAAGQKGKRP